jgi:tetratricopeptide (TPR) repeat protein
VGSVWLKLVVTCAIYFPSGLLPSQQPDAFESLLASAQQAQAREDFESATELYSRAVKFHPEIPELRTNLGLMYYQTGKNELAAEEFRAAIRLKPSLFVPNLFLGLDYIKLKKFHDAIPYLKRAALSKPADTQAQLGLGQAYAGIGNTRLAIDSYLRANESAPKDADIWYHLGIAYLEQVEADARVLLTHHMDSGYVQALLADTFAEQHAFVQAADAYKKAVSLTSFPPDTHANYGFLLLTRREFDSAEHEFTSEVAANPGSLMAKLGLARLHLERGETEKSANEIDEISKADAAFLVSHGSRFGAGLTPEKRAELDRILDQRRTDGSTPEELLALFRNVPREQESGQATEITSAPIATAGSTTAFYNTGRYKQCTDALASKVATLQVKDLNVLATCAFLTGNSRTVFDVAKKLAAIPTSQVQGLYWETKSAEQLATVALARASELDSGSPKLHVLLGDIYRQRKSYPQAEGEYRKALALRPEDTGALFGLSLALLADDQVDEALHVAQAALKNSADDPELNAVMGEILCARNDFAGAEPYLKKSLNTKPEYVVHVHALLGKVYARTDRTEQAIAELKLALAGDKDGTVHYQLARLYLKVGDRDSAKQAFEASRRLRSEGLNRASVAMQQGEDEAESQ